MENGETRLVAGVASGEITPSPGIHMGGYWGRRSGAVDVHDPLMAKVLTFAVGEKRAALVSLDLVGLDAATVGEIRGRIEAETGILGAAVMVCCSHTHAGPLTVPFRGMGVVDLDYMSWMQDTVVELAGQAASGAQPVRVAHTRVPAQVGINRRQVRQKDTVIGRNPQGPVADYAHVVRFDGERELVATLFSHACHGVVLGSANHRISADFAGAAARYIEAETGAAALYVNGACGDINPRKTGGDFADVEELGGELGKAVVAGLAAAGPIAVETVRWASEKVALPLRELPPRLRAEAEKLVLQLKAEIKGVSGSGGDVWAQRVPRARLAWAEELLERVKAGGNEERRQPFEVQTIGVGGLALVGMEGEIFVRYQLDLEAESPFAATILCGYANGCVGYVPTADEYERGGYEVEEAYKVYPSVQMIAAESEEMVRNAAQTILAKLAS